MRLGALRRTEPTVVRSGAQATVGQRLRELVRGPARRDVEQALPLEPGDTFVLFSDGVSEAMNSDDGFYGEERLLAALAACDGAGTQEIVGRVLADVREFAAGAKQSDDITVLAARFNPPAS